MNRYFHCAVPFLFGLIAALFFPLSAEDLSALDIPPATQCYFSAVAASDLNDLSKCFEDDAVIIDVNRKISGLQAIHTWADNEVMGGRYEILSVVSRSQDKTKLLIIFVPPGLGGKLSNGFKAHYTFEFKHGKIIRMDLQYA